MLKWGVDFRTYLISIEDLTETSAAMRTTAVVLNAT